MDDVRVCVCAVYACDGDEQQRIEYKLLLSFFILFAQVLLLFFFSFMGVVANVEI